MRRQKRFKLFLLPAIIASSYIYSCSLNKDKFKDDFEEIVKEIEDKLPSNKTEGTVLPITPIDEVVETSEPEVVPEPEPEVEPEPEPEAEKYTVTFVMGETEVSNQYEEGEEIIYPDAVEIEHYHFVRWDQYIQFMPADAIRIEAIYEINKHTLTFNLGYGNIIQSEVDYGSSIAYPEIPTNDENVFTGWDLLISTMPDEDIVISATWREKVKGSLTYIDQNNNEVSLSWQDLIDMEIISVRTLANGKFRIIEMNSSSLEIRDGVLIIDESISEISVSSTILDGVKKVIIPDSVNDFSNRAFEGCTSIEEVVLGPKITSIGHRMFAGCSSLKSINLDNITSIGFYAFENCISLPSIDLPPKIESLDEGVFSGCTLPTEVTLNSEYLVNRVPSYLYKNCTNLRTIHISKDIKRLGYYMFHNCYNLEFDFLEGIEIIEEGCFSVDTSQYEANDYPVVLPSSIKDVHGRAFGSSSDSSYFFPMYLDGDIDFSFDNTSTLAGYRPFRSASALYVYDENGDVELNGKKYTAVTQIKIPRRLTHIPANSFINMNYITDIYIPKEVESLGGRLFWNCPTGSVNVHYEGTQEEWDAIPKTEKQGRVTLSNKELNSTNIEFNTVLDY